mmetsp:Transcript_18561/g.29766  ORF Transcript_18561/g.29766 Transcript_18561/m.29766 type:complete len:96 (+) Transcript_18561:64-351(+)
MDCFIADDNKNCGENTASCHKSAPTATGSPMHNNGELCKITSAENQMSLDSFETLIHVNKLCVINSSHGLGHQLDLLPRQEALLDRSIPRSGSSF